MHEAITAKNLDTIKDPVFRERARLYMDIQDDFKQQVQVFGLDIASERSLEPFDPWVQQLTDRGLTIANDHKSLHTKWISPACVSCRKAQGTATFLLSTQCPRSCFFCFNPNQEDYERLLHEVDDAASMLAKQHARGFVFHDLALTGGEPLLHKEQTMAFFSLAKELYPKAYTRLYTSGAYLDEETLRQLAVVGLKEIRFSIKTDDPPAVMEQTFERIRLARAVLPHVLVEMPVMPNELELMQGLLKKLDELGIDGINLLEFCFPYNNAEEFVSRGYKLKPDLFRVFYNYSYAAGLPVAGSEEACLKLLGFALDEGLSMGVHYCTLENKYSGQIYMQNLGHEKDFDFCTFSQRDYFLKSAKAFGLDVGKVECALQKHNLECFTKDDDGQAIGFPLAYVELLREEYPSMQLGLSYHVVEGSNNGFALRELRIDLITPETFDPNTDV